MARGDLLKRHIDMLGAAIAALELHHMRVREGPDTSGHELTIFKCRCVEGQAWRWFQRQQADAERRLYRERTR